MGGMRVHNDQPVAILGQDIDSAQLRQCMAERRRIFSGIRERFAYLARAGRRT